MVNIKLRHCELRGTKQEAIHLPLLWRRREVRRWIASGFALAMTGNVNKQ